MYVTLETSGGDIVVTMTTMTTITGFPDVLVTNVTTVSSVEVVRNSSYSFSPPNKIWGLDVEMFSYIFLAIGGIAPVIFIIIVIIAMKCYTWRKMKRFHRYEERYRTGMELWEAEKQYQLSAAMGHAYVGPGQVVAEDELQQTTDTGQTSISSNNTNQNATIAKDYTGLKASTNNPNVYFRNVASQVQPAEEGPGPQTRGLAQEGVGLDGKKVHIPRRVPIQYTQSDSDRPRDKTLTNGSLRRSINSDEEHALKCFDRIYESFDISSSDSENGVGPAATKHKDAGFRRTSSIGSSDLTSDPQVPLGRSLLDSRSTSCQGLVSVGAQTDLTAMSSRASAAGIIARPGVQLMVYKPADNDLLVQRQSWLHSSYVNVAYEPDNDMDDT